MSGSSETAAAMIAAWANRLLRIIAASSAIAAAQCADEEHAPQQRPTYTIHVSSDRLEPNMVTVQVNEQAHLVVRNYTDESCSFHFGPWVEALNVRPAATVHMDFTVSPSDSDQERMVCANRDHLHGEIHVVDVTNPVKPP